MTKEILTKVLTAAGGAASSMYVTTDDTVQTVTGIKYFPTPSADNNSQQVANTQWVNTKLGSYLTKADATSTYATKTEVTAVSTDLSTNYLTKTSAGETYATKTELGSYLTTAAAGTTYATKTELGTYMPTATANSTFATKAENNKKVSNMGVAASVTSAYPTLTGITGIYVCKTDAEGQAYSTAHPTELVIVLDE